MAYCVIKQLLLKNYISIDVIKLYINSVVFIIVHIIKNKVCQNSVTICTKIKIFRNSTVGTMSDYLTALARNVTILCFGSLEVKIFLKFIKTTP